MNDCAMELVYETLRFTLDGIFCVFSDADGDVYRNMCARVCS